MGGGPKIYCKLLLEGDFLIPNSVGFCRIFLRFKMFDNVAFERKISLQPKTFGENQTKILRIKWNLHANKKTHPKPKASQFFCSHLVQLQLGFFVFQVAELAILSLVAIAIEKANAKAPTDLTRVFFDGVTTSHRSANEQGVIILPTQTMYPENSKELPKHFCIL